MTSKQIAQRFAGKTLKCKVTKSSPVCDANGNVLDIFDAKIIGWKLATLYHPSYVCVEVLPPGVTKVFLAVFNDGYTYTADRNDKGFGKKLLAEEVIVPVDETEKPTIATKKPKNIPEWPDKCRDCGQPAVIMSNSIDCSNPACKNKYKTHSGLDLFLPVELRPPGWDKDPFRKRRKGIDKEDFIVCEKCNIRANDGTFAKNKIGTFNVKCPNEHSWTFELNIGDKLAAKGGALIYKGKNVFVAYRF